MLKGVHIMKYWFCVNFMMWTNHDDVTINGNDSPWDWGQIDIEVGTKHVIYQKLEIFLLKNNIYVDRLESVIFGF